MCCRIADLKNKQVVSVRDGCVIGFVGDVEFDTENGRLTSIIIYGRPRFFGLFGREDDIRISWKEIAVIGSETVLVNSEIIMREKGNGLIWHG